MHKGGCCSRVKKIKRLFKMEGYVLNPAKCVAFFSSLVAIGFLIGFTVMLATHQPTISCPTRSPCPTNTDVNLPEYSENDIVIEDATTSITISEILTQPESINSKPGRTIIPVEPEVVIDAIDPHQVEKDERTKNLTIENSRKKDLDVDDNYPEFIDETPTNPTFLPEFPNKVLPDFQDSSDTNMETILENNLSRQVDEKVHQKQVRNRRSDVSQGMIPENLEDVLSEEKEKLKLSEDEYEKLLNEEFDVEAIITKEFKSESDKLQKKLTGKQNDLEYLDAQLKQQQIDGKKKLDDAKLKIQTNYDIYLNLQKEYAEKIKIATHLKETANKIENETNEEKEIEGKERSSAENTEEKLKALMNSWDPAKVQRFKSQLDQEEKGLLDKLHF